MENAVEALKMAAAVLIFVIAIATTFNMFSQAKTTVDAITLSQDQQEYLDSAEVAGELYTTTESASTGDNATITTDGYRIVKYSDVISTIYRYNLEKYGVTIVKSNGTVIARFDSNTENVMRQYYNISSGLNEYVEQLKINTTAKINNTKISPTYDLKELYKITVDGNKSITCGAPWYGNDSEITKRINADISGEDYTLNKQTYTGKGLKNTLKNVTTIIEVVNEIDNSKYLEDGESSTSLLQQYELPTVEIIYVIY